MAYRMTHTKSDGSVSRTRVDGHATSAFAPSHEGTRGVVVHGSGKRFAGMNLHPSQSKYVREREIEGGLNRLRNEYANTRGFSNKKNMKHVAQIPAEYWWTEKWERGPQALRDPKELRRFCTDHGFNVSKW